MLIRATLAITTLLSVGTASAAPIQYTGAGLSNGFYYDVINVSSFTAAQAKVDALSKRHLGLQGRLAAVYDSGLTNFFRNTLFPTVGGASGNAQAWLAGTDASLEGTWKWVNHGSNLANVTYTNWNAGQPDNWTAGSGGALGEDFMSAYLAGSRAGRWNDLDLNYTLNYYVIEYSPLPIPVPASVSLMFLSLAGFTVMARRKKKAAARLSS